MGTVTVVNVPVMPQTFPAAHEPTVEAEALMKVPEGLPKAMLRDV
jgi:hypothetical protein